MTEAQGITLLIAVLCIEWKVWRPIGDLMDGWYEPHSHFVSDATLRKNRQAEEHRRMMNERWPMGKPPFPPDQKPPFEHAFDEAARLARQRAAMNNLKFTKPDKAAMRRELLDAVARMEEMGQKAMNTPPITGELD